MRSRIVAAAVAATILQSSNATNLYTSAEQLSNTEYDFVIVGGGTAGSVLANRLSAHPNTTVLLIEAGSSHHDYLTSRVPLLPASLEHTTADWNYTTSPQAGYNNRSIAFARGHVLGGSSTVNYMAYNRASNETWDKWAAITRDDAWSWNSMEPYYRMNSQLAPPAGGRDVEEEYIAAAHGDGPVQLSIAEDMYELGHRVIRASKSLGGRFKFNRDLNAGDFVGFSWLQGAIAKGERSSAATAYLEPLFGKGEGEGRGLDVLLNTKLTRLLPSGEESGMPAFRKAEILLSHSSAPIILTARNEVILSAGVINTPQILLRSGIGPASELSALGIPVLVDLPSVGRNLTDHPMTSMFFRVKKPTTNDAILQDPAVAQAAFAQWMATRDGPLAKTSADAWGFMRLPDNDTVLAKTGDPSAGPASAHTEILFGEGFFPLGDVAVPESGNYITVLSVVTSPTSRGSVTLDYLHQPVIDPNYMTTEFDQHVVVQGMKDVFAFFASEAFEGYIGEPYGPLRKLMTDGQLLGYVRRYAGTINHGVGTAKMSPRGAGWGVVDPDLKVKGTRGTRIVDASVFPEIPDCHTMAPVYIVAERAAAFIAKEWGLVV